MKLLTRVRATTSRAPIGLLNLMAVAAVAIVPVAHAAASADPTAPVTGATGTVPAIANDAAFHPQVTARISDRTSLGRDGIHLRGLVTHAGTGDALVTLNVRRVGSRHWNKALATHEKPDRTFKLEWIGKRTGRYLTRLTVQKYGKEASTRLGAAFVYRRSFASWYGPGLYGGALACGGRLTASVVGVANKTLPCGTRVTFNLHGRTVTARVVDRGPYVAGRDWDLTPALKRKLHFGSTGVVNATS